MAGPRSVDAYLFEFHPQCLKTIVFDARLIAAAVWAPHSPSCGMAACSLIRAEHLEAKDRRASGPPVGHKKTRREVEEIIPSVSEPPSGQAAAL